MFVYNNGTNVVEAVNSAVTLDVTTLDATNIEVTNIKAKDGTSAGSIANSTGVVTLASSVLTTTDINGGTIDNTAIGASTPAAGTFTQVDIVAQGDLRLQDTTGGQFVALQAPGTIATSYTLTLPVDDGTNGQALITDGNGVLSWSTAAAGDVYGPASATDNAVARFDLTTGKIIQNSVVIIADTTGDVTGVGTLSSGAITTTGVLTLPAGTVSAPALTTTGDTNTGIYFPAADTIAFTEGGAEAMRIDSSGNVGIGTSSPSAKLDARGQGKIGSATGSSFSGTLSTGGLDVMCGTGTKAFQVWDDNSLTTPRICVERGGNVGIGTSSPAYPLEVIGGSIVTVQYILNNGSANPASTTPALYSPASGTLGFNCNGSERMRITSAGLVGIGTSSPDTILHVDSANPTTITFGGVTVAGQSSGIRFRTGSIKAAWYVGAQNNIDQSFEITPSTANGGTTFSTPAFVINNSGNVGIGTNSPIGKLAVTGGTTIASLTDWNSKANSVFSLANPAVRFGIGYDVSDHVLLQGFNTLNAARNINLQVYGGNVGIGTSSPNAKLDVVQANAKSATGVWQIQTFDSTSQTTGVGGGISFGGYKTAQSSAEIFAAVDGYKENSTAGNAAGALRFHTQVSAGSGLVERMRINSSGNVGIGTSSPSFVSGYGGVQISGVGANSSVLKLTNSTTGTTSTDGFDLILGNASSDAYVWQRESAPLIFGTAATERMRIVASGGVGIGVTNPGATLSVLETISIPAVSTASASLEIGNGRSGNGFCFIDLIGDATYSDFGLRIIRGNTGANAETTLSHRGTGNFTINTVEAAPITFNTTSTERMRINSTGSLLIGSTNNNGKLYVEQSSEANTAKFSDTNASTTSDGVLAVIAARNTTNNTFYALSYYNTGVGAYKFRVADSGDVTNTNNSYGAISDIKLKENIVDATPKLEDLCKVKVRQYNLKSEPDHKQIGVIAQELEEVFAGLVETVADKDTEGNDLGTTTKQVKYSVFVPMLIKAIQEQQTLINNLTTRLNALEGK
jgi:hypothetical protein